MPESLGPEHGGRVEFLELTGQERSVSLVGRTMPRRGVSFPRKMKTAKTVYPGNPIATIQVLGPEYENTSMGGEWNDRFVSTQGVEVSGFDQPQTARDLVAIFTELSNSGNAIRVQYGDEAWQGVMVAFTPSYERIIDIGWDLEMEWSGPADDIPTRASTPQPTSEQAPLLESLNNMDDVLAFQPSGYVVPSFKTDLAGPVSSLRVAAGQAFDAMRTIQNATTVPVAALGLFATVADTARAVAGAEASRLTDLPYTAQSLSDRVVDVLAIEGFRRTMALAELGVAAAIANQAATQTARLVPARGRIVVVKQNATLRSLALLYYGSADAWTVIADANGLTGSMVPAGTTLYIPPASASAAAPA